MGLGMSAGLVLNLARHRFIAHQGAVNGVGTYANDA